MSVLRNFVLIDLEVIMHLLPTFLFNLLDDTDADGDSLTVSAISYSGTGTAAINAD